MPNDINELDTNDVGLKQIFGDRFHDETTQTPDTAREIPKAVNTNGTAKAAQKPVRKPVKHSCGDTEYQPVNTTPNWLDNLKASAKYVLIFGGLNLLIFYWQQAELMDASVALPSMIVCAALAGWGVGKNATRGNR